MDIKPKRAPCFFSKASLYSLRISMIGCISISLKVVSIAVDCLASNKRSAIRARRRVIGTRFSARSPVGTTGAFGAAGAGVAATGAGAAGLAAGTSSFKMRPSLPEPCTSALLKPASSKALRAAGPALAATLAATAWATRSGAASAIGVTGKGPAAAAAAS